MYYLNHNNNIKLGDILITSTSLEKYIPYINSIFNSLDERKKIPFFISKKSSYTEDKILSVFNKILNLPNSRFINEDILEFLHIPEIAKNFNIFNKEIKILYYWMHKSNICWGINTQHHYNLGFCIDSANTWEKGIKKLLLSYAMNHEKYVWSNTASCVFIDNSRSELIGKLYKFIIILNKWRKKLSKKQYLTSWKSLLKALINDFFIKNIKTQKYINYIKNVWNKIIQNGLYAHYTKKISVNILKKIFFYIIASRKHDTPIPGIVNFCHPSNSCYIPFKIICIIGADQNNIIKKDNTHEFNLMHKSPKIGDPDNLQKNCYLLLQQILCTKKYFYVSYIEQSTNDTNSIDYFNPIKCLFKYILNNFSFLKNVLVNKIANTKQLRDHIFKKHDKKNIYFQNLMGCNKQNNIPINKTQYIKELFSKKTSKKNNLNIINLKSFLNFWKNPICYFVHWNLKNTLNLKEEILDTTEPFSINSLNKFKMNNILLKKMIYNEDIDSLLQYYTVSGVLPYGNFGNIFWRSQVKEMQKIANIVLKYRINTREEKINLKIKGYELYGSLKEIQETGLLRWKPNTINYKDRISLWLEHLIYSILGNYCESTIIGYKNNIWSFAKLKKNIALDYLKKYVQGYVEGIENPIILTKSGYAWCNQIYDKRNYCITQENKKRKKGYQSLLNTWNGNDFSEGEKKDFYIQQIVPKLSINNMKIICKTAEKWFIPILHNQKK